MPRIIEVYGEMARIVPVADGTSINDYMIAQNPELKNFPVPTVAGYIKQLPDGQVIPTEHDVDVIFRADWGKPLAKDDTIVLVAILKPLGGGGGGGGSGGVVQAVLGAVLVITAALMWWNPMGWASIAALSGSFLASMALTGGVLLLSGIMGMFGAQPKGISADTYNEGSSPTYSINATTNQARLLQPVPESFGKIMCTPDIVANPYTLYQGNDQYMCAVYGVGRGEYVFHELYFGDDCFWNNGVLDYTSSLVSSSDDVQVQFVKPGDKVTLFPDNVESNVNVSQIQLFHKAHSDYTGWMGPWIVPPAGTKAQLFQFDFVAPRGVGWFADNGKLQNHSLNVAIQYRKVDDNDMPITNTWTDAPSTSSGSMATLTPQRWSHFIELPLGRYEFQVQNTNTSGSTDSNSKPVDELYLDGLRAYLPGTLKYNQSCIAIKVRATNALSNNASQQFKCLYTRKLPIWNQSTRTWSAPQATRRFDAAIAWMCKADWGGRLSDSRIDLDALAYCQKKCDENEWNFDAYVDTAYSVMELIVQACAPYRVFPRLFADKISFIFDEANRPVKHIFTPRDIRRGSLQPSWAVHTQLTPDDVIVSYLDEDVHYARREVDCVLPDSMSENSKYVQFPLGVCSRKLAHDYGIYIAACNKFRRVKMEFTTEAMSRLLFVGDVISIQHPRLRAVGFGKVVDWNEPYLRVFVDTADCDFDPITRQSLWAAFNKPDGSVWGPVRLTKYFNGYMQFNKSDYDVVKAQQGNPFQWLDVGASSQPTTFALLTGKSVDRRFIIQRINFEDLNHATITAMNDDPRVYSQVVPIPPWTYRNVNSSLNRLDYPLQISYTKRDANHTLRVSWSSIRGAESYTLYYQDYVDDGAGIITHVGYENYIRNITGTYIDIPYANFLKDKKYRIKVRSVAGTLVSAWSKILYLVPNTEVADE